MVSRRRFIQYLGLVGASLSAADLLAACLGQQTQSGPAVVTFLKGPHYADELTFQRENAALFHQSHPNITAKPSLFDWAQMDTQLTTAYAGNPSDITYLVTRIWPEFAEAGSLMDLTSVVKDSSYASEYKAYTPATWNSITDKGKIWGIPLLGAVFFQIVNLDLLAKAGISDWNSSYDKMRVAAKATTSGNVFGFYMPNTFADEDFHALQPYVHNSGAALMNENRTAGGLDTPAAGDAFEILRQIHVVDKSAPAPGQYSAEAAKALFLAGRIAIFHSDPITVADMLKSPPGFKWQISLAPPGPAGQTCAGDYGYLSIAAASKVKDAAWEYAKFVTSAPRVAAYVSALGKTFQAIRTDVADQIFGSEASVPKDIQKSLVPKVVLYSPHPKQVAALRALDSQFNELIRGHKTGAQMVRDANQLITGLLK